MKYFLHGCTVDHQIQKDLPSPLMKKLNKRLIAIFFSNTTDDFVDVWHEYRTRCDDDTLHFDGFSLRAGDLCICFCAFLFLFYFVSKLGVGKLCMEGEGLVFVFFLVHREMKQPMNFFLFFFEHPELHTTSRTGAVKLF